MSAHVSQALVLLVFAACSSLLVPAAGQNTYGCSDKGVTQRRLTNYGKYSFILHALPPNISYLLPNMDCTISIIGYSTSRWIVSLDTISLGAYQGELEVFEGSTTSGKNVISLTSSGTVYRQFGISSGSFTVRQTTKSGPAGIAFGVRMTVEHLDTAGCPSGWYTVSTTRGYCYGVPKQAANLASEESAKACNMLLANLVMGNSNYDTISSELLAAPTSVVDPRQAYWVGMYEKNDELKFLNKYSSLDSVSGRLCSQSSTNCQCIAYQSGRFYKDSCTSKHQYVCYMPSGGTNSYYDINSLISKASSIITFIVIVLTIGFVVIVVVSLIIVFVCCIRGRSAAARRNRRSNANANAGPVNIGGAAGVQPPYPTGNLPPPPPPPSLPPAPPYTISAPNYSNYGFESGANGAGAAPGDNTVEKRHRTTRTGRGTTSRPDSNWNSNEYSNNI